MEYADYYRDFGRRVRDARGTRSQADLAGEAGMTRAAIANIESGRHRVTMDVLDRLARALEMEPAALLPSRRATDDAAATPPLARGERAAVERVMAAAGLRGAVTDAAG